MGTDCVFKMYGSRGAAEACRDEVNRYHSHLQLKVHQRSDTGQFYVGYVGPNHFDLRSRWERQFQEVHRIVRDSYDLPIYVERITGCHLNSNEHRIIPKDYVENAVNCLLELPRATGKPIDAFRFVYYPGDQTWGDYLVALLFGLPLGYYIYYISGDYYITG